MSNWIRLFVAPSGHIGRRSFWHGFVVVMFVNTVLLMTGVMTDARLKAAGADWLGPLVVLVPLFTLYPSVCIHAKRLRDIGRPAWLQAPSRVLLVSALVMLSVPWAWERSQALSLLLLIAFPLGLAGEAALTLWLGTARSQASPGAVQAVFD